MTTTDTPPVPTRAPGLTRYRYDRIPLTQAQAKHARDYQIAYMDELVKNQRQQLDAATMARTKLRQSKPDTHRVIAVPIHPGEPGYDEASPAHPQDALQGGFGWVGDEPLTGCTEQTTTLA